MSGFFIPPLGEEGFRKRAARSTQFFWEYPFPSSSPSPPPPPGLQILCTKQSDNKRVAKNNLIAIYYVHCIFYCFPTYILEENGYIFIRRHLMYMILFMNFFGVWFCFLFFSVKIQIRQCNTLDFHSPLAKYYYIIVSFK